MASPGGLRVPRSQDRYLFTPKCAEDDISKENSSFDPTR
jgi:hypothetical protein